MARLQKEYTPEELAEMEEEIPEWKRGAVVATDHEVGDESGFFKRLGKSVGSKINETEYAKNFYESEEYKKIEEMRANMQEFKHNVKDELDTTQNPLL